MECGYRKLLKNPRESASLSSIFFFGWSIPIFKKTYTKVLGPESAYEPLTADRSQTLGDKLEKCDFLNCVFYFLRIIFTEYIISNSITVYGKRNVKTTNIHRLCEQS